MDELEWKTFREWKTFQEWNTWDFDTWQGRLTGGQAAIQILSPIAAVAFGMTISSIVLRIVNHSVA
jgi:hypothetical protein